MSLITRGLGFSVSYLITGGLGDFEEGPPAIAKTLEECLFDYLTSYSSLSSLIGTKLYPDLFPQNIALPAIAYTFINDETFMTQEGPSALRKAIYQFDIWTERIKDAWDIMQVMRNALDGFRGQMGDQPGIVCQFDKAGRTRDAETMAFCISMQFRIFYHEVAT